MFPISVYALIVWLLVVRYRRTWKAFAVLAIGAGMVLPLADPMIYLVWWMLGERPTWLYPFFYIYSGVLVLIGVFLALLPMPEAAHPCRNCGYDLSGNLSGVCPECGRRTSVKGNAPRAPRYTPGERLARASATDSAVTNTAPTNAASAAAAQDSPPAPPV